MNSNQPLLTSFKMGDLTLKNRIIMAPMTRSRSNNKEHAPTVLQAVAPPAFKDKTKSPS